MTFRTIALLFLVATIAGSFCVPLAAADLITITPTASSAPTTATSTLPPERIQETLDVYPQWLQKLEQRNAVAGLATAIVVNDKVVFEDTIGYADTATHEPMTPQTVFRLASLSKAFATALTGLLVNEGKLSWDTPLSSVLPSFRLWDDASTRQATVRDVLGQRLGLPHNAYDRDIEHDVPYDELVQKLDEVDPICDVGQCYSYQNVAFSLIGDVIAAQTGDDLSHLVSRRLFAPLGMTTASYGREALEASASWAHPHHAVKDGWMPVEPKDTYYHVAPAAGVNASLRDMEQWLIAQMGGRPDVLPPPLLDTLRMPEIPTPVELRSTAWRRARLDDAQYALGWRVFDYSGETLIFHAGAVDGYRTMIGYLPKYRVGIVTLWNSSSATPTGLMPEVFDSLLGLPHVDWADIESDAPAKTAPVAKNKPHRKKSATTTQR